MRVAVASVVTGLLLLAPLGASTSAPGAVGKSAVSGYAAEDGEPERASGADYWTHWTREWRRRWRVEHRANVRHARIVRRLRRELSVRLSPAEAVCAVFGSHCSQALRVAECESHLYPGARNGQYLGVFQMGESEREKYGHGPTVIEQARAAYRYFAASGFDWSPWECKP